MHKTAINNNAIKCNLNEILITNIVKHIESPHEWLFITSNWGQFIAIPTPKLFDQYLRSLEASAF
jgi:hypothetical protein